MTAKQRRVVFVCCDALVRDWINPDITPVLDALAHTGVWCDDHHAVFPSVTRASAASIATGCRPGRHGLHGNRMGLIEEGRIRIYDVGKPDFRTHMRRATGRTLHVPTLAGHVAQAGGFVAFSNVSPGAAYFLDPENAGQVYHRAGSFGPGGVLLDGPLALNIAQDFAGDRTMTTRFCHEALTLGTSAVSVLWLAHPDATLHKAFLGSPEHHAALRHADQCVAEVVDTVRMLRARGEDILLLAGSDHGQETIAGTVDLEGWLSGAGLSTLLADGDIAVAGQGTSALLYATAKGKAPLEQVLDRLRAQPWADGVESGDALSARGLIPQDGIVAAVNMARTDETNPYGIRGMRWVVAEPGKQKYAGHGEHGGWGADETRPFLIAEHPLIAPGVFSRSTSLVDIAPTALDFLGIPATAMEGKSLWPEWSRGEA